MNRMNPKVDGYLRNPKWQAELQKLRTIILDCGLTEEVKLKKPSEFNIPEELKIKLDEIPALKAAFAALTPGRQRGYLLYFSAAKQSKTRAARVEKCMKQILKGKGIDDA